MGQAVRGAWGREGHGGGGAWGQEHGGVGGRWCCSWWVVGGGRWWVGGQGMCLQPTPLGLGHQILRELVGQHGTHEAAGGEVQRQAKLELVEAAWIGLGVGLG